MRVMAEFVRRGVTAIRQRGALWARWRRTPVAERRAFVGTACLIPLMTAAVRLFEFRRTYTWLSRRRRRHPAPAGVTEATRQAVRALVRARRYAPYRGNCLSQSLTLWWRLRQAGVATDLILGATLDDGLLEAHAWVEQDGRVLNDTPGVRSRFEPIASMSSLTWR
jgi:hypothetical protein